MYAEPSEIRQVAVLGAGNGGCAAAAHLVQQGFELRLWNRSPQRMQGMRAQGGIAYSGAIGEGFSPLSVLTTELKEALSGTQLVLCTVPTQAHGEMAGLLAPHLDHRQILMASPGHTLMLLPHLLREHGIPQPVFCETGTLPYICRMDGDSHVRITQAARDIAFAVFPAHATGRIADLIRPVFATIRPVETILDTVFTYSNAIHHPPAVLCNVGRIEATGGDYYHYYEGISPAVGRLIDRLDRERLALGKAFGVKVAPFVEHFHRMGYTTEGARDSGLAYEAFHQSEPDRYIRAPSSLDHRFLNEDIPYGLVLLSELGRMSGVATTTADHLIDLASVAVGRDYRAQGLTLHKMGLEGCSPSALLRLLKEGFAD